MCVCSEIINMRCYEAEADVKRHGQHGRSGGDDKRVRRGWARGQDSRAEELRRSWVRFVNMVSSGSKNTPML